MTVDDLMTLFQSARQGTRDWNGAEWVGVYGGDRAGVTAVVRALRDEIVPPTKSRAASSTMLTRHVLAGFDEILGDAGEKVTIKETAVGAVLRLEAGDPPLPATDAAPAECSDATAVCVWEYRLCPADITIGSAETECGRSMTGPMFRPKHNITTCACGKPIVFKAT